MQAAAEPQDKRGWASFSQCCDVIVGSLGEATRATVLGPRPAGVTVSDFGRIFVQVFEAAIEASRDDATWDRLNDILVAAGREITFRPPQFASGQTASEHMRTIEPRTVFDCFARCFACAVARSRMIPPEPSGLASEFERCRSAWESAEFEYLIVAPVTGIRPSSFDITPVAEDLGLAWNSTLSEAARDHLQKFRAALLRPPSLFLLLGKRRVGKPHDPNHLVRQSWDDVKRCVTAIRLATGRNVGCDTIHFLPSEAFFQTFNGLVNLILSIPETTIHGEQAIADSPLTDAEVAQVATISELLGGGPGKQVTVAVDRFNWAMGRPTPEDQVIDLAIALESMICRGGGKDQLAYRFRLFGAAVLADVVESEHGLRMLRALYETRSSVVHAGKSVANSIKEDSVKAAFGDRSVPAVISEWRELTRLTILDFVRAAAAGRSPDVYMRALQQVMTSKAKNWLHDGEAAGEDQINGSGI